MVEKHYCDCQNKPTRRDCKEHYKLGERTNGIYRINSNIGSVIQVFCDQSTDGGGWTVFQRRVDGSTNFFRNWTEYEQGFGKLNREHWLGNPNIYILTAQSFIRGSELRIDMRRRGSSTMYWAKYSHFDVDGAKSKYILHVSGYSGNAGDHLSYNNKMMFSTYDQDNDRDRSNCAYEESGGWWYKRCTDSNLNGVYDEFNQFSLSDRVTWQDRNNDHLQFTEMKLRRL